MARFHLATAGVLAALLGVLGIQPAGAVQPCANPTACAQLGIGGSAGAPGDVVNVEVSFQQGPSDGSPGGLDEIAALALTLSLDANGMGAPLLLADCEENANGLPNAITPDAALANFNIAVQNARCSGGHTHCLCPDPASGIAPDRFVNVAIYGSSGPTLTVTPLPSGRLLTVALQIGAGAAGTMPLHVYNSWSDSQHPLSTALASIGDDLQVDQTCVPLSKPPCGAGSVSQLAITDGAVIVIPTPTPTITSTGTATVTGSPTATPSVTSTATRSPTGSATTTPSTTASASPTSIPSSTLTPSAPPTSTATQVRTPSLTPPTESTNTPILTPTPTPSPCVGDCNVDGTITIDEIIALVDIALGNAALSRCPPGDENRDQHITIDEILSAVNRALNGC